jgi:hypothetical protein
MKVHWLSFNFLQPSRETTMTSASIIEALGLSCVAGLDTFFLEARLPAIAARDFGGDSP